MKRNQPRHRSAIRALLPCLLCSLWLTPSGAEPADDPVVPPAVGLDQLLRIPPSVQLDTNERGHNTKTQWREKYDKARADLEAAKDALREAQQELAESPSAGTAWQMGAPGLGSIDANTAGESPTDPSKARKMRNRREEVARTERVLAELDVEANLANVPMDWRGTPPADAEASGSQARK